MVSISLATSRKNVVRERNHRLPFTSSMGLALRTNLESRGHRFNLIALRKGGNRTGLSRGKSAGSGSAKGSIFSELKLVGGFGASRVVDGDPVGRERSDEGVTRANSVNGLHARRGNTAHATLVSEDGSLSAKGQEDGGDFEFRQAERQAPRLDVRVLPGEHRRFVAVDDKDVHGFQEVGRERACRSGVENNCPAGGASNGRGFDVAAHRNFELE